MAMVSYGIGKSDSTELVVLTLEQFPSRREARKEEYRAR